jgi:hypothetical protein
MSPSKKSAKQQPPKKKQPPLPKRVDFKTWRARFERILVPRTPEGKALSCWLTQEATYLTSLGETERAQRDSLLESLYLMTRPKLASDFEKKKHESAVGQLRELLLMVESTVKAIKGCGSQLVPKDGHPPLDMSELLLHLEESAFIMKGALSYYLNRPHMHSADALSYCVAFISGVIDAGVDEPGAIGLAKVAMRAHGYDEEELGRFSVASQRAGTPRKRRNNVIDTFFNAGNSYLEQERKHKNIPGFNPAHYRQKKDHLRKTFLKIKPD